MWREEREIERLRLKGKRGTRWVEMKALVLFASIICFSPPYSRNLAV